MTITTQVRINWPVHAEGLLDAITVVAGGDPATVKRISWKAGDVDEFWKDRRPHTDNGIMNRAMQGLSTLADVRWQEHPNVGDPEDGWPAPPALVILSVDNPHGTLTERGRWWQANKILPAAVEWLDEQGVPRESWWWEDESAGTFHPGTTPVAALDDEGIPRETWRADQ